MLSETLEPIAVESEKGLDREHLIAAVRVKNEVEWVNPDIELSLPITPGEPTEVAVMVIPTHSPLESDTQVLGLFEHKRSVLIGRTTFKDKQGNTYRDIDSKGSGFVEANMRDGLEAHGVDGTDYLGTKGKGLLDLGSAHLDQAFAEIFSEAGVRVVRPIAVIKLHELVDETGHKITVQEARARGLIPKDLDPAIELRAFGTRARIGGLPVYIKDAMRLVADEIGIDYEDFGPRDYMIWFAKTLGEQLRKIHELGFTHAGLHDLNITLDCRIVDFDSAHNIPGDYDERGKIIYGEGYENWRMLAYNFRYNMADVFPEIGDPTDDDLMKDIEAAFKKGYGELTDEFIYGHEMYDDYDEVS